MIRFMLRTILSFTILVFGSGWIWYQFKSGGSPDADITCFHIWKQKDGNWSGKIYKIFKDYMIVYKVSSYDLDDVESTADKLQTIDLDSFTRQKILLNSVPPLGVHALEHAQNEFIATRANGKHNWLIYDKNSMKPLLDLVELASKGISIP